MAPVSKSIGQMVKQLIPDTELKPQSVDDVLKVKSFNDVIKESEEVAQKKYATQDYEFQQALSLRRLQQLTNIALLNPLWKERLQAGGLKKAPASFDEWQSIPLCDKNSINDFFTGSRPGMVVPINYNGFEIVASGGTTGGRSSETVYSLKELHDTYRIAGDFIGTHMLKNYLDGEDPKWVITTLADYQMWSSGTMVGGVLQYIPGVNYIGAGPVSMHVFHQLMSYKGPKAIMGISQSIAYLLELGVGLDEDARNDFRVAMYGSGVLTPKVEADLKEMYPNISILSYFAATQAEAIGLQLDHTSPLLAAVPGLHFIEIVDEEGRWVDEGKEGELVVTRLHATEVPVLRFKIGDRMIRRSNLDTDELKTSRFEFAGRSNDVIHMCDTQYPAPFVYDAICGEFQKAGLFDLKSVAHEIQFVNNRTMKHLTLLIAVDNPEEASAALQSKYENDEGRTIFARALNDSLSVFNKNEANMETLNKTKYQFEVRFVCKMSPEIYRTELGKVPLLRDMV